MLLSWSDMQRQNRRLYGGENVIWPFRLDTSEVDAH